MGLAHIIQDRIARANQEGTRLLPRHCRDNFYTQPAPQIQRTQHKARPQPIQQLRFGLDEMSEIRQLRSQRVTFDELAARYRCSKQTVYAVVHRKGAYGRY